MGMVLLLMLRFASWSDSLRQNAELFFVQRIKNEPNYDLIKKVSTFSMISNYSINGMWYFLAPLAFTASSQVIMT